MLKDRVVVAALVGWFLSLSLAAAPQNYALRLGPGTELEFPHHPIMHTGSAATIEYWCRSDGSGHDIRWYRFAGSAEHKQLQVLADGAVLYLYAGSPWGGGGSPTSTPIGLNSPSPGSVPEDGAWHHIAFVRRATGAWSLYLDGQRVVDQAGGTGLNSGCWLTCNVIETVTTSVLGHTSLTDPSWDVDEVRISSIERYSAASIVPQRYFVSDADTAMHLTFEEGGGSIVHDSGPAQQQGAFVSAGTPTWSWITTPGPTPSSATVYGAGCGSPALTMSPGADPVIGSIASATIGNAPLPFGGVGLGFSNTTLGGLPILPLSLVNVGMPGCQLWHSNDVFGLPVTSSASGALDFALPIPGDVNLLGSHVYLQAYAVDLNASPRKLIASNGIDWLIGNQ